MTRLSDLAQQAFDLHLDDAPDDVRERLRLQSLSMLGASASGTLAPDVAPILAVARKAPGSHSVVPGVTGLSLDAALRVAAGLSVSMDFDDYLLCGHTGHTAYWAAWLGGAELGRDWAEVQRAQLVANEVMGRLGGMCLAGRQNGQAWSFLHAFGAALVGGLLRRLSPERLAHALAISLSRAPYVDWRTFHTGARVLVAGEASAEGWRAAELAEAGLDGPLDLLEDGSDLLQVLADGRPMAGWLTGIGSAWLTQTLTFKMVPGCAYLGSAVETASDLLSEFQGLAAADVLRIDVDGGLLTAAMERLLGGPGLAADGTAAPLQPIGVNFSVARSLALLFARGSLGPRDLTLEGVADGVRKAGTLSRRIHVHHDWRMTLTAWDALKTGMGIDRLLSGLGPSALLAAASRSRRGPPQAGDDDGVGAVGWPGFGTGLAWSELPVALAQERFGGLDELLEREITLPGRDLVGRSLEKVADRAGKWVSRRVDRLLGTRDQRFDLGAYDLRGVGLPIPARVKVLVHGGRVYEAERDGAAGSPLRPDAEVRRDVRSKFVRGGGIAAPARRSSFEELATRLVTADGDLPDLSGGPGEFLADWAVHA
ncbi:MAG: MmgE/PrpD family protein [Proteobacteria bacterium]|nr:MmgE/PrpD family protein [Pseudomonadota bacterium]